MPKNVNLPNTFELRLAILCKTLALPTLRECKNTITHGDTPKTRKAENGQREVGGRGSKECAFAQHVPETISELSQPLIVMKLVQDFNDPPGRCKDPAPKFPDSLRGGSGARPMAASWANLPK